MANEGKRLTDEEVVELEVYKERGIAPPAKFDDVVFDATMQTGAHYRFKTQAEKDAERDAEKAATKAADVRRAVVDRIERRHDLPIAGQVAPPPTPAPVTRAG